VLSRLSDTKAAAEVQSLRDFNQMLGIDQSRAFYGYDHVAAAAEAQAVDTLLVTDSLFRYFVSFHFFLLLNKLDRYFDLYILAL